MKQTLQLRLGQQLTMTPQLQQAIRLLQLSTLELHTEIQQALESNPLLELLEADDEADDEAEDGEPLDAMDAPAPGDEDELLDTPDEIPDRPGDPDDRLTMVDAGPDDPDERGATDDAWQDDIPDDLPVDSSWDDVYAQSLPASSASSADSGFDNASPMAESLHDSLAWQLNLVPFSDIDRLIATTIIDAIDDDGFLRADIGEIVDSLPADLMVERDEVEAVLHRIQQFEPAGVAARNLGECLALQLRQIPCEEVEDPLVLRRALSLVEDHLELLGRRDLRQLMRRLQLDDPEELREVIELVRRLSPRPGAALDASQPEYIVPDVIVHKLDGRWLVELNPEATPRVRVNPTYAALVRRADSSADNRFLRDNLQEARWFIKSLQSRNETLLKVASEIVHHQRGFLDYGEEAMKPLVLHDIAEAIDMHESTISRVTTRKYMHTPRGIFELKYFFSSHVGTKSGGEVSSTAIRALIRKLTANEDPARPLSDSKIARLLGELDINVARRTVAKYRESLSIPSSNERRRLM